MDFLKDPRFWGPMFGFLTALMGFVRWLLRVAFVYRQKADLNKAHLDSSVEKMKTDNAIRLATTLKETIDKMKPTIEQHSIVLEGFKHSFDLMIAIEADATKMMKDLKVQYGNFTSEIMKFSAIGDGLLGRMKNIETEVEILKSGNLFIRTKK